MTTKLAPEEMEIATITETKTHYFIEGLALLETLEKMPEEMNLTAYVFDPLGKLLGSAPLDAMGRFNVPVLLDRPADVQLVVGPAGEPDVVRASSVYKETFHAKNWIVEGGRYLLKPRLFLPKDFWVLWRPIMIGITGHVRTTEWKPIPYLKVEIFDVDREPYFFLQHLDLLQKIPENVKVLHIPDLLAEMPIPHPGPGPEPVALMPEIVPLALEETSEVQSFETKVAPQWLNNATLLSEIPLWRLLRFYSKRLVDTVYTGPDGSFTSCFKWFRFHARNGQFRYDPLPDIIVRVTQVIDGVEKVLYMDPYASTRWDVTNAHIDLWLDDPQFLPGNGSASVPAPGMQAFFTRIGNDEVFHIDQATGLYSGPQSYGAPNVSNVAYGSVLYLHGQLGENLGSGLAKRYYRMAYRKGMTGNFTYITTPLADARVDKTTLIGETCSLGPKNINGTMGLYEIRDLDKYYWYNPDWLMEWSTAAVEAKTGLYTLRLEVFDENGQPLPNVDYRDGTADPDTHPNGLPKVAHCDLVLAVQNLAPKVLLKFLNVPDNGVLPFSPAQEIDLQANVSQENGLIYCWGLYYTKGLDLTVHGVPGVGGYFYNGIPAVAETPTITVSDLGITGSNTVAFKLWAWSHIRNGYTNYVYENEQVTGIAFQDCSKVAKAVAAQYEVNVPIEKIPLVKTT